MAVRIAELETAWIGNTRDLERASQRAERTVQQSAARMNSAFSSVGSGFGSRGLLPGLSNISNIIQGIPQIGNLARALINPLTEAAEEGLRFNMLIESATLGFEGVTGGAQQAARYVKELTDFAAANPIFNTQGTIQAARMMATFGFETSKTTEYVKAWGGALAAGGQMNEETLQGVVRAFGQMRALGRVNAEEMNQLAERGIPGWELLAKAIGKTVAETRKLGEQGKLRGGAAVEAITAMIGQDPRFAGAADRFAKGLEGRLAQLQDLREVTQGKATEGLAADLTKTVEDALRGGLPSVMNTMAEGFKTALVPVGTIIKASVSATLGGGITGGLTEGITAGMGQIGTQMPGWVNSSLIAPVMKTLGMNSPSRVFHDIGFNMMLGLQGGIQEGAAEVWKELKDFAEAMGFEVTSTTGGRHNPGSLHRRGRAVDVRTRGKSQAEIDALMARARELGIDVTDERTRPAGQKVWGGPHLHMSAPQGFQLPPFVVNESRPMPVRVTNPQDIRAAAVPDSNFHVTPVARGVAPDPTSLPVFGSSLGLAPLIPQEWLNVPNLITQAANAAHQGAASTRDWYKEVVDLKDEAGRFGITMAGSADAFKGAWFNSFTQIDQGLDQLWRGMVIDFAQSVNLMVQEWASSELSKLIFGKSNGNGGMAGGFVNFLSSAITGLFTRGASQGSLGSAFGNAIPKFAGGGDFNAGQWFIAGDKGPELIRVGRSGGHVYNAGETRQMSSRPSVTNNYVTINAHVSQRRGGYVQPRASHDVAEQVFALARRSLN